MLKRQGGHDFGLKLLRASRMGLGISARIGALRCRYGPESIFSSNFETAEELEPNQLQSAHNMEVSQNRGPLRHQDHSHFCKPPPSLASRRAPYFQTPCTGIPKDLDIGVSAKRKS